MSDSVTVAAPATYDSVTVTGTGVLAVNAVLTVTSAMTIESGGWVTHSGYAGGPLYRLELTIEPGGRLWVQDGGRIDVSGRGLRGGQLGGSAFAEGYDATGTTISRSYAGGGSYGGPGGTGDLSRRGPVYGVAEDPQHYGGGGSLYTGATGGSGGGLIRIEAAGATVRVDGVIASNGGAGQVNGSNAGAGGGIRIVCDSLVGAGTVEARGVPVGGQAAGGGGRIAVYAVVNELPDARFDASGGQVTPGSGVLHGGAGTVFLKLQGDAAGRLLVRGPAGQLETALRIGVPEVRQLEVSGGVAVTMEPDLDADGASDTLRVADSTSVRGSSAMRLTPGARLESPRLRVESGGELALEGGSALVNDELRIPGGAVTSAIDLDYRAPASVFELSNGGRFTNQATLGVKAFDGTSIQSGTVDLALGSRLIVTSDTLFVASGDTLVKDGAIGASGDQMASLTIASGGVITHAGRDTAGLVLNVTGTLEVQGGATPGKIDVTGKGLRGGVRGSERGEAIDPVTGEIIPGAYRSAYSGFGPGASYGGVGGAGEGGASNAVYGFLEDPRHVGSGGGGAVPAAGGNGGGRVHIIAGSCVVDGWILASGDPGQYGSGPMSGGGSGGGIRLDVGTLSGSGRIEAVGGDGPGPGYCCGFQNGTGGGGRIAIYYDTLTLPTENIAAHGGGGAGGFVNGSAGTIYLKDNHQTKGDLVVNNGGIASNELTPLRTKIDSLRSLRVRDRGTAVVEKGTVLTIPVFDGTNVQSGTFSIAVGGRLNVISNKISIGTGVRLVKDGTIGDHDLLQSAVVDSGGVITHSPHSPTGMVLRAVGKMHVRSGGYITVDGLGLYGGHSGSAFGSSGEASDDQGNVVLGSTGGSSTGAGGSYGGLGGEGAQGTPNSTYGDVLTPQLLGAGGASASGVDSRGGNGGGRITLLADSLIVDGILSASGGDGVAGGGGGAGGSVLVTANALTGAGEIDALGGKGNCSGSCGGAGGGGRISLNVTSSSLPTDHVRFSTGSSGNPGQQGTVFFSLSGTSALFVTPPRGGTGGTVTLRIMGPSFSQTPTAALRRAGLPDIPAVRDTLIGTTLLSTFDLTIAALGTYDVSVSTLGGTATALNAFSVEPSISPKVELSLIGPTAIFQGLPEKFYLRVTNSGNVDAHGCLLLTLPPGSAQAVVPLAGPVDAFKVISHRPPTLSRCAVTLPATTTIDYMMIIVTVPELSPHDLLPLSAAWLSHD